MEEGAIGELIGSRGRREVTTWEAPRTIASLNALLSLLIKLLSRYYRDNECLETLMI